MKHTTFALARYSLLFIGLGLSGCAAEPAPVDPSEQAFDGVPDGELDDETDPGSFDDDPAIVGERAGATPAAPVDDRSGIGKSLLFEAKIPLHKWPQGMWRLSATRYLITQDIDGRDDHDEMRFYLVRADGTVVRHWDLDYGSHGQSLYVKARADGAGYKVFTEANDDHGLAQLHLSKDLTQLHFVRHIRPRNSAGTPMAVKVFAADEATDTLMVVTETADGNRVRPFGLAAFLDGTAAPKAAAKYLRATGSLQGVAAAGGHAYVLKGNGEADSPKAVFKVDFAADRIVRRQIHHDFPAVEPEGVTVAGGRLVFGLVATVVGPVVQGNPTLVRKYFLYDAPVF